MTRSFDILQCVFSTKEPPRFIIRLTLEEAGMHKDDSLFVDGLVLWLRVDGVEHPFDSTGHFPVLAGYDTSGREIFVARASFGDVRWMEFCYVCDGVRSVSIICRDGKRRTTSRFKVMVLKHDPCDVRMAIPAAAKFPNRTSVLDAQGGLPFLFEGVGQRDRLGLRGRGFRV